MRKLVIVALLVVFTICIAPYQNALVYAQEVETELFTLAEPTSIVFSIEWETEEPSFSLIAPDGSSINAHTQNKDVAVLALEKAYMILIRDAAVGSWKLLYDKGSNESIAVSVDEYIEGLWITQFEIGEPSEGRLPVVFYVEHDNNASYSYTLSLTTHMGGAEKVLFSSTNTANKLVQLDLDLSHVNSYEQYVIKLNAWIEHDGVHYFDFVYSDPFSYQNDTSIEAMQDIDVYVDMDNATLTLDWSKYIPFNADDMLISIYDNSGTEPSFIEVFGREHTQLSTHFDTDAGVVRIEARWRYNGLISNPLVKTITANDALQLSIGDSDNVLTNRRQLELQFDGASNQEIQVSVNGQTERVVLNGSGEKWIPLQEGHNIVEVAYTDTANIHWSLSREIYLDLTPPLIEMLENFNGMTTTSDRYIITGQTDPNATLVFNDLEEVPVDGGYFTYDLKLAIGANPIQFTAKDPAGNTSSWQGVIHRSNAIVADKDSNSTTTGSAIQEPSAENGHWTKYWPLFTALIASTLLSVWALTRWKHRNTIQQQQEEVLSDS